MPPLTMQHVVRDGQCYQGESMNKLAATGGIVLLGASSALGASMSYSSAVSDFPVLDIGGFASTDTVSLPRFDSSLGTLGIVRLSFTSTATTASYGIDNDSEATTPVESGWDEGVYYIVGAQVGSGVSVQRFAGSPFVATYGPNDGDASGPQFGSDAHFFQAVTLSASGEEEQDSSVYVQNQYIVEPGLDMLDIQFSAQRTTLNSYGSPLFPLQDFDRTNGSAIGNSVTITYFYSPVPEPTSIGFITCVAGVSFLRRSRRHVRAR
jgi:hypothetical protein